ncbi:caspase family protein [Roseibium sp. MMSF_3544]|uniref:caspase family protein n=1 Tax=unclassified Roseibium TaxID=2629323 RepID=UPI00273DD1AE|nr:caspase family protein [Roseibium sp. MMSF_3544]
MRFLILPVLIFFAAVGSLEAAEERRVALVIGNGAYENVAPLANPTNDASAIAESLERLGFEVILGLDLDHRTFVKHMKDYARRLQGADLALFFYAGHGLQVDGTNYLAPVNTELADEIDLEYETVQLNAIIRQMERRSRTSLIFLDACRNNPLARNLAKSMGTRNVGSERGLAPVETGIGTLIAYSTQPGNVALDGSGRNSPFSAALLKHMETPGADIAMVLRRVRQQVLTETGGRQVPWSNSSLTGEVVLKSGLRQDLVELKRLEEEAFWTSIKESSDPGVLENYIKRFPEGLFVDEARLVVEDLIARRSAEKAQIEQIKAQAAQQADFLRRAERENEKLMLQLQAGTESQRARLEEARLQVAEREKELADLSEQNETLKESFQQSVLALETRLQEAEDRQEVREQEVVRLRAERSSLENQVEAQTEIRQTLQSAVESAEKSALETEQIRSELSALRSKSLTEISSQNQELARARQQITKARKSAEAHRSELLKLQTERDVYIEQYLQQLRKSESEREALAARLAELEEEKKQLEEAQFASTSSAASAKTAEAFRPTVKSVHLDRAGRIALQMSLKEFGYDPGAADGNFGPQTFQAIMGARLALNLPEGSHVDRDLIKLLPDVSKLFGAYDGAWVVVRTAADPGVCGWTQVKQRLEISRGSISGPGYVGEVYSDGSIEMTRSFIQRHKRRQSLFEGKIGETGGAGTFAYDFNACKGEFVLHKGDVVSLHEEDLFQFDRKDRALVSAIQSELNRLGCDVGTADGIWGGRSRLGLRTFSSIYGKQPDSRVHTMPLLDMLKQSPDGYCKARESARN